MGGEDTSPGTPGSTPTRCSLGCALPHLHTSAAALPASGLADLRSHGGEQVFPGVRAVSWPWGTSFPDVQTCLLF